LILNSVYINKKGIKRKKEKLKEGLIKEKLKEGLIKEKLKEGLKEEKIINKIYIYSYK
jgi:hypothetical protein